MFYIIINYKVIASFWGRPIPAGVLQAKELFTDVQRMIKKRCQHKKKRLIIQIKIYEEDICFAPFSMHISFGM